MKVRSRKNRDGSTSWLMDYRIAGTRYRDVLQGVRTKPEATRAAEEIWAGMNARLRAGASPFPEAQQLSTLNDLLAWHLNRTGIEPTTRALNESHAKPLLRILGASTPILALTGAMIELFKRERGSEMILAKPTAAPRTEGRKVRKDAKAKVPRLGSRKVAPLTVNIELMLLRGALNAAVEQGLLKEAPCAIKPLPVRRKRPHVLTPDEVARLAAAAPIPVRRTILFLANTGLRKSEFYRLRWADVAADLSHILVQTMKRGASRDIRIDPLPLNATAKAVLREVSKEQGGRDPKRLVFGTDPGDRPRGGTPTVNGVVSYADNNIGRRLKNAARDAKLSSPEKVTLHTLRHTFATHAHSNGATIRDTAALLRHRSPKLTMELYAHEGWDGMVRAVESLETSKDGHEVGTRKK